MDRIDLLIGDEVPVIVLDNFWTDEEIRLIWEELEFFTYFNKLQNPENTETATLDGKPLKNNRGLFLDDVWLSNRNLSNILQVNRKIFNNDMEILKKSPSWFYQMFICERDTTLLSYYENNGYYKPHADSASITILHWFYKEPKKFEGGNLILHYNGNQKVIDVGNNKSVILPSTVVHEVTPITMEEQYQNQKLGRYCVTQFLNIR